jgi:hypothetical protein
MASLGHGGGPQTHIFLSIYRNQKPLCRDECIVFQTVFFKPISQTIQSHIDKDSFLSVDLVFLVDCGAKPVNITMSRIISALALMFYKYRFKKQPGILKTS